MFTVRSSNSTANSPAIMPLHGHCNCERIKVTIQESEATGGTLFCHCLNCRRQSGGIGTVLLLVPEDDVKVEGSPTYYLDNDTTTGNPMKRWFCANCGRYVSSRCCERGPLIEFVSSPLMSTTPAAPGKCFLKMGYVELVIIAQRQQLTRIPSPECLTRSQSPTPSNLPSVVTSGNSLSRQLVRWRD